MPSSRASDSPRASGAVRLARVGNRFRTRGAAGSGVGDMTAGEYWYPRASGADRTRGARPPTRAELAAANTAAQAGDNSALRAVLERLTATGTLAERVEGLEIALHRSHIHGVDPFAMRGLAQGMTLVHVERVIQHAPVEHAVVIGSDNRVIAHEVGVIDGVTLSEATLQAMRDDGNAVLTHNQPMCGPISAEDIEHGMDGNAAAVRMVRPRRGSMSVARPAAGWPTGREGEILRLAIRAEQWRAVADAVTRARRPGRKARTTRRRTLEREIPDSSTSSTPISPEPLWSMRWEDLPPSAKVDLRRLGCDGRVPTQAEMEKIDAEICSYRMELGIPVEDEAT
jgi:hypothetical protein